MKGKGSRLAILLALVLTLVGAFSSTAFAADTHTNFGQHDFVVSSDGIPGHGYEYDFECSNASNIKLELILSSDGIVYYDGNPHEVGLDVADYYWDATNNVSFKDSMTSIEYGKEGESFTEEAPIEEGEYDVRINFARDGYNNSVTVKGALTILKKSDPEYTVPKANDLTYSGEPQALVTAGTCSGGTVMYAVRDTKGNLLSDYDENVPMQTDVGTYRVYCKIVGDESHNDVDYNHFFKNKRYLTVRIAGKAAVKTAPKARVLTYSKADLILVTEGSAENGTIVFSSDGVNFNMTSNRDVTGFDAGSYNVWYKVKGNEGYDDTDPVKIEDVKIKPRPVTVSGITANKKTYNGDTDASLNVDAVDIAGLKSGDEVTVASAVGTFTNKNVGTWDVTISNITLDGDDAHNYVLSDESQTSTNGKIVARKAIIAEGITAADKPYDGTDDAIIDCSKATITNVVEGESLSVKDVEGTYSFGPDVKWEDGEVVTKKISLNYANASLVAGEGTDANNYEIAKNNQKTVFSKITPITVIVSDGIASVNKYYDGTAEAKLDCDGAVITPTVDGEELTITDVIGTYKYGEDVNWKNGEPSEKVVELDYSLAKLKAANASTKASNYVLAESGNQARASMSIIFPRPVTITGLGAKDKTYDGTARATITVNGTEIVNKIFGDEVVVQSAIGEFEDKNAGKDKDVFITDVTLTGADKDNYCVAVDGEEISEVNPILTIASINKLEADLAWYKNPYQEEPAVEDVIEYKYNGNERKPYAKVTNKIGSDGVDAYVIGGEIHANTGRGKYVAEVTEFRGEDADNYSIPNAKKKKEFRILPRAVNITWGSVENLVYNGKDQTPEATVNNTVNDDVVNATVDVTGVAATGRLGVDFGFYTATVTSVDNSDYCVPDEETYPGRYATITKDFDIDQLTAVLLWDPDSFNYDGDEHVPEATVANLQEDKTGKDDECTVTVEGGATDANNGYVATATDLSNPNYSLSLDPDETTTTFDILPRKIQVAWSDTLFIYDAKAHTPTATITNLANKDKGKVIAVVTPEQTNVGTYTATVSRLTGDASGNYTEGTPKPKTQFEIRGAILTVTANNQTIYNTENFNNTSVTYSGWKGSDNESVLTAKPTVSSNYALYAKAGTYTLTPGGAAARNYVIQYNKGTLTVKDNVNTITAKAVTSGNTKAKLSWNAVTKAAYYDVYLGLCNHNGNVYYCEKFASGTNTYAMAKGLKKGTCYKFYVIARDANDKQISKSLTGHFIAGNVSGNYTNAKSISVKSKKVSLNVGNTSKIKVTQKAAKANKKLLDGGHAVLVRYRTSNSKVATVSSNGTIKAVGSGFCRVYAQSVNGMWATVEVTVN